MEAIASQQLVRAPSRLPGPLEVFSGAWRHRSLILRLTRRDVEARYRGSLLGLTWSLLVPLVLLVVYTYVFSVIFQARWAVPTQGKTHFALVLWSGLILFNFLAECLNRAPTLMLQSPDYVKRVVFPLEVLVWVTVGGAAFNALVGMVALLVGYLLLLGLPPVTSLLYPLLLLPLALLAAGSTWLLSSLGVFVRDLQQIVPVFVTVLMMMSPVFYPKEAAPPTVAALMRFNPVGVMIEQGRVLVFGGDWPHWRVLGAHLVVGWLVAWGGLLWFARTRKAFADVV